MVGKNSLQEFWDFHVRKSDKHFSDHLDVGWRGLILKSGRKLMSLMDGLDIKTVIDWGCGGGIISQELCNKYAVVLLDISLDSILEAEKKCDALGSIVYPQEYSLFAKQKVDCIFSHAVIHHFPSIEYFKNILFEWKQLRPKYLALQIKSTDGDTWSDKEYYNFRGYLNGLVLNRDHFVELLNEYGFVLHKNFLGAYNTAFGFYQDYYVFENESK